MTHDEEIHPTEPKPLPRKPINVVHADDHVVIRIGIRNVLSRTPDIQVIGEASNGQEAIELVKDLKPDILLLDVEMPVMDGIEALRQLQKNHIPVKTIVLSAYSDEQFKAEAFALGCCGYLRKDKGPEQIIEAIRCVARGDIFGSETPSKD
jgi:DNA-binding NarL/FixJ family response regulator